MSTHHRTVTEFYLPDGDSLHIGHLAPIRPGDLINIRKQTYRVQLVTWAIDYADELHRTLRCNVELESAT